MKKELKHMYRYTECGLDNVFLKNGFTKEETPYGKGVRIMNLDNLHKVIGLGITDSPNKMSGKEFRFLRLEMNLSQARIGKLFDVDEQTVARWEKGISQVPGPADKLMKTLFKESIKGDIKIKKALELLAELDAKKINKRFFEADLKGWRPTDNNLEI